MSACLSSFLLVLWALASHIPPVAGQERATSTPVRVLIPTGIAPELPLAVTPAASFTPLPAYILLEAKEEAGAINVRAAADINSERLGAIQSGEYHPVLGRRYRWLQIEYPTAPSGRAWVYEELVNLIGDESLISDFGEAADRDLAPADRNATRTQAAFTRTPGAMLTVTARARLLPDAERALQPIETEGESAAPWPTFTWPATFVADPKETAEPPPASATPPGAPIPAETGPPPIVPIVLLLGAGILGLIVNALRRS